MSHVVTPDAFASSIYSALVTGGRYMTSFRTTWNLGVVITLTGLTSLRLPGPSSVTTRDNKLVVRPLSIGVAQKKAPVCGSITAPAGASGSSEKVNFWGGRSASAA